MRRMIMALALLAGIIAPLTTAATPAMAADCTGSSESWPWYQWTRSDNQVYGVRAPIEMRVDGGLCGTPGGGDNPYNPVWIAIVSNPNIVQIGFIHAYGVSGGHWCRVWANGLGMGPTYDCGVDADDSFVYFKIVRYYDPVSHVYKYEIDDCGSSSSYAGCTTENSSQTAFLDPAGQVASEADYTCVIHIMGANGDRQGVGTSLDPLEGSTDDGSSWSSRSWGGPHWQKEVTTCRDNGDYNTDQTSNGMEFWDSRNAG